MPLSAGTRLGPYEVGAEIGAGGMGQVYRATDTRLGREVAIKTIKGPYTERFEREAQAISSLNHPHICTLFDVGEHDGSGYLVMEYVEGGPIAGPLTPERTIAYGIQICEALHAAHRKGIVHRDLKPGNILLTKQGIKLLDFGLAKLDASSAASVEAGAAAERATIAALTGAHTVVGTPQYMAPEQIEGGEVDARTDIFAFGCVLYELLTGRRAFPGKTTSSVMAAILASKPQPLEELVPLTPPALERVVARCLAKDPEDRWQSARDIAAELQWIAEGGSRVGVPVLVAGRRKLRERLAWAAFAVAAVAAAGFAAAWAGRAPVPPPVVRFAVSPPAAVSAVGPPALSPDGRMLAFDGIGDDGHRQVWLRPLDALEARPIPGTEGAYRPFWSPDSRFVAFIADGKLKKVSVSGGPSQTLAEVPTAADGAWSPEGVILLDGRGGDPIWRVSANGGLPATEVENPGSGMSVGWPEFLPDGRHFLYMTFGAGGQQSLMVRALGSGESKQLLNSSSRVQYAPPGFLLYVREQTLVAQPFDAGTFELTGEPIPVGEGLGVDAVGLASFSISRTGVLALRSGESRDLKLAWMDRAGQETPLLDTPDQYRDAALAPDGSRLAFDKEAPGGGDIWIRDLGRGVTSRFTFDPASRAATPHWSPDGRRLVFSALSGGVANLVVKEASGTTEAEMLLESKEDKFASDWTRDGTYILYSSRSAETNWDVWALPLGGDRKPVPIVRTRFSDLFGTVSPDGKYLAYFSNASGQMEVYVQEFPEARQRYQVSTDGGTEPFWRADGRELYYRLGSELMAVPVQTSPTFVAGAPAPLFRAAFARRLVRGTYRPTPDGKRFLVLVAAADNLVVPTIVVLNWTSALGN